MADYPLKIFLLVGMDGSPFNHSHSLSLLKDSNYMLTDKIADADIVVAHNYKKLFPYALIYPKKTFLVWTNEPRYDTTFKNEIKLPFPFANIKVMNVYGKDVFWHNLHFLSSYHFSDQMNLGIEMWDELSNISKEEFKSFNKKNTIASIYTNTLDKNTKLYKNGKNIDLSEKRCRYALAGHKRKLIHIYGNKWPKGFALDNSGYGFEKQLPWWTEKINLLKDYKYNLCLENTANPYYVTEKIWHAIVSYSLPIYNSFNSSIYETFPDNSFIDIAKFQDENDLFDFIESMSLDEYIDRLNLCVNTFNSAIQLKRDIYKNDNIEMVRKIVNRLESNVIK